MPALILVHSDITYAFLVLSIELLDVFIFFHPLTKQIPYRLSSSQTYEENIMPDNWLNVAGYENSLGNYPHLNYVPVRQHIVMPIS
jgi:hypothetical protein